jgi:chemotaxis protein methyltransferase CheR
MNENGVMKTQDVLLNDISSQIADNFARYSKTEEIPAPFKPMSHNLFLRFSEFIHSELGIKMPEVKKTMLQARLQKRLRKLGIRSFDEYYNYVFSAEGIENELHHMIDVVTTNKTDFFREPQHFDYLFQTVLPEFARKRRLPLKILNPANPDEKPAPSPERPLMVWSAGCSTGEEPYSVAMVLSEFAERCPGFTYSILASDISTKVLKTAMLGIYDHERAEPIPLRLRTKYLLRSKDKDKDLVRLVPELRAAVKFRRVNLMEKSLYFHEKMDIIFFRNVLIYFDRPTQESVLRRLCNHLKSDGYMFLGHSETLNGLNVPLVPVITAVYRKLT